MCQYELKERRRRRRKEEEGREEERERGGDVITNISFQHSMFMFIIESNKVIKQLKKLKRQAVIILLTWSC